MKRIAISLIAMLAVAAPAVAQEAAERAVIMAPAGTVGVALPYRFTGTLGPSGLQVQATPTMLLVTGIAAGSPAALADVPLPDRFRLRVAAINGKPIESFALRELLAEFNPVRGEVRVTLARKGEQEVGEVLMGPYAIPLASLAIAAKQADWLAEHRRFDDALALTKARGGQDEDMAARLMLAAQDAAAGGDYGQAAALASKISRSASCYAAAQRLIPGWRQAQAAAVLQDADGLAAAGSYEAAIAALKAMPGDGGYRKLRELREARWSEALAEQAAYKKAKAIEQERKAAAEREQARASKKTRLRRSPSRRPGT